MASPRENELAVSSFGAILAITVGWFLIVPPFISQWRFYKRIGRPRSWWGSTTASATSPGSCCSRSR